MTVVQVRVAIAALLQSPPLTPRSIAAAVTRQLRRNEEARAHRWHALGRRAPRRKRVA